MRVSQNHPSHWRILFLLLVFSLLILKRIHHFVSDETLVTALLNKPYLVTFHRVKKSIPLLTSAEEIQPHTCYIFSNGDFVLSNNFIGVILLDKINLYRLRCLFIVHYCCSLQRRFQMAVFKSLLFLLFMCCVVCRSLTKPLKVEEGADNKSLSKGRFWNALPAGWYSTDHSFKY